MARYTRKQLDADLLRINAKISASPYTLKAESRNGYMAVDLFKNGIELHAIGYGSPLKCKYAALDWVVSGANMIKFEE